MANIHREKNRRLKTMENRHEEKKHQEIFRYATCRKKILDVYESNSMEMMFYMELNMHVALMRNKIMANRADFKTSDSF